MLSSMYVVGGGNRHTLSLELDDGAIVVDTKAEKWSTRQLEKIRLATENDVTILVNTNPGGALTNAAFTEARDIIAHENTKARLAQMDAFKGANAKFLPNRTFTDKLTLPLKTVGPNGTNRVDLFYFGKAHSDGDIVAVFPSFAVAYFGELFPEKGLPTIDVANGGSMLAFPDTLARALDGLKDAGIDCIVPARAPLPFKVASNWFTIKLLQEYIEFTRAFVDAGKTAFAAGKSVDEAVAGLQMPEAFKDYSLRNASANMQVLYGELTP
jgi:hypothetical protein